MEWAFYLVCFQTWQVLLTCFLTHGPCNSLPCYGILVTRYLVLFIRPLPRFAASSTIAINLSCSFVLQEFCLSICRKISSLVCLLFCLTHIFHFCFFGDCVYFFAMFLVVVSFFCFAIITCTIFLSHVSYFNAISIAIFRFHSPVRGIYIFFVVLYIFSVSLSFLLGFCTWFPRIFRSALLVPTLFLTYCLAFLVFFPFFFRVLGSSRSRHCLIVMSYKLNLL